MSANASLEKRSELESFVVIKQDLIDAVIQIVRVPVLYNITNEGPNTADNLFLKSTDTNARNVESHSVQ